MGDFGTILLMLSGIVSRSCRTGGEKIFTVSCTSAPDGPSSLGTTAIVRHGPSASDLAADSSLNIERSTGIRPYPPRIEQRALLLPGRERGLDPFRGQVFATRHFRHSIWREFTWPIADGTGKVSGYEMSPRMSVSEIEAVRSTGRALADKGFFELDLVSSRISWMNDFALSKIGMDIQQARSMTVYDIVPEEFHEPLNNFVSDAAKGRASKFYIWPNRASDGDIVWWYFIKVKADHPSHWFKAEFLNKTKPRGPEFASLCAAMNTANGYNDLFNKIVEFQGLTSTSVDHLTNRFAALSKEVDSMQKQITSATDAANKAATAALEVSSAMKNFKSEIQDQLTVQTTEILKLITTDTLHDKRIQAFEAHIKKTTDNAVQIITVQADKAGRGITTQADKAGKSMARKVTVPIGLMAAVMTILQWLISHYMK